MSGPLPSFVMRHNVSHVRFKFYFSFYMALAYAVILRNHCCVSVKTWFTVSISANSDKEEQLLRTWVSKPSHEQAVATGTWWQPLNLSSHSRSTEICF